MMQGLSLIHIFKEKAESFSDSIINNTPNAIIVMAEDLVVQQIDLSLIHI